MEPGVLVKLKTKDSFSNRFGIVIDEVEMSDTTWYEIFVDNERHWFEEQKLERVHAYEAR